MAKENWADDYDINLTDDKRIQEAFEMFDEDGSGAISAEELQKILTRPGTSDEKLSIEEIDAIIARYDDNSDGELQYEEFARLWTAKRRGALGVPSMMMAIIKAPANRTVVISDLKVRSSFVGMARLVKGYVPLLKLSARAPRAGTSQGILPSARILPAFQQE